MLASVHMRTVSCSLFLFAVACGSEVDPSITPVNDAGLTDAGSTDAPPQAPCMFTNIDTPVGLTLTSVWGASENDVWVGTTGRSLIANSVLLRFNGTAFTAVNSTTFDDILDIAGTAADDVWIAATLSDSSSQTLLHWNGVELVKAAVPAPPTLQASFRGLWPRTRSDVWLVGDSTLLRFNGAAWTKPPTFSEQSFDNFRATVVTGSSDNEVLVGRLQSTGLRWDGTSIKSTPMPAFRALKRASVGPYWGIDTSRVNTALVSSTDGVKWTQVRTFTTTEPQPISLAVDASGNPWIGTSRVTIPNGYDGPFAEHLVNGSWQKSALPELDAARAIAVAGRSVWAVGGFGKAARCLL